MRDACYGVRMRGEWSTSAPSVVTVTRGCRVCVPRLTYSLLRSNVEGMLSPETTEPLIASEVEALLAGDVPAFYCTVAEVCRAELLSD